MAAKTQLVTTQIRVAIRVFVTSIVGAVVAWFVAKAGSWHAGTFAILMPVASSLYYIAIAWLEKKFPSLGWLLGILPQPKSAPTPTPAPAPAPAPTPASARATVKAESGEKKKK